MSKFQQPELSIRPTKTRWVVLGLVAFASSSAYLTRYCISAANTTIQAELSFDDIEMGWILSAFGLGYLFFQVPAGMLGNKSGTRFAFAFISAVWSLCNVWSGAAAVFASLWASRFGLGVFQAGLTPLSAKILKDWIPHRSHGVSSASIGACMSIGGAFTLWVTGELLQNGYSWRGIFFVYSLVGIVWAICFYWFFRTFPEEHSGVNKAELALIRDAERQPRSHAPRGNEVTDAPRHATQSVEDMGSHAERGNQEERVGPDDNPYASPKSDPITRDTADLSAKPPNVWRMFSSPSMLSLCVTSFFRAAGYIFFATWFFAFLEYVYGIGKDQAGLLTSLPLIAVVIGSMIGGVIVDVLFRLTSSKWISRCGTGLVALAVCACLTLASAWTNTATQLSVVMAMGALFSGLANPASWAVTIDLGGKHTAIVMGTMNMAGCLSGAILPIILGNWFAAIKQSDGDWNQVIYLHGMFYFAAALGWLFINPNRTVFER